MLTMTKAGLRQKSGARGAIQISYSFGRNPILEAAPLPLRNWETGVRSYNQLLNLGTLMWDPGVLTIRLSAHSPRQTFFTN